MMNMIYEDVDLDFYDLEKEPPLPVYENSEIYGDSTQTEKIVVESDSLRTTSDALAAGGFEFQKLLTYALEYLKRNWAFLSAIFILWLMLGSRTSSLFIYRIPIIGFIYQFITSSPIKEILIFFTAAYNGPVGFLDSGLSPYTFLVALTGKSAYLLAMTGVLIPSVKALVKSKDTEILTYKENFQRLTQNLKAISKNLYLLGFALAGAGGALVISNLLTRNGKMDKTFVLLLLSFTLFKGLAGALPSALDFIARRLMALYTRLLPGGIENGAVHYENIRTGATLGFILALIVGSAGEKSGYILGVVLIVAGAVLSIIKKEKI